MSRTRHTRFRVAAAVGASALAGGALAVGLRFGGPATGVSMIDALAAVAFGVALAVALLLPEAGLVMSLAYAASPLSFYILFRNTDLGSPYAPSSDLALDAAITLGLAGAATVGAAVRSWAAGKPLLPTLPAQRPLIAIAALLAVTAVIGVAAGNPVQPLLADIVPFAELGLLLLLTTKLAHRRRQAIVLVLVVAASLGVTAIVRMVLYSKGPGAFGVEPVYLAGGSHPRLYQTYPFGWVLPFALAYALAARGARERLGALALALLCGLMVLLSFERGLWVVAAVPTLAVVLFGIRHRPRVAVPLLVAGLTALVVGGGLIAGSGFSDPVSLIRERLAGTSQQLQQRQGLRHKRQDEASALWRTIRRDPAGWPLGHGLGAEYVGPTGIRESTYATSFQKKHYSFNWYLGMALRTGLIGLVLAIWLVGALAAVGFRAYRRGRSLLARGAGLALASGLVGLALEAPIDPYLLAHPLAPFQGATVALVALFARRRLSEEDG